MLYICGCRIGRHSKSLDTNKKVCGVCKGKFELLVQKNGVQTPAAIRTPNKFAQFVKVSFSRLILNRRDEPGRSLFGRSI